MHSLPFQTEDAFAGFGEGHGMARFDGAELVIEFQIKDGLFGVIKSPIKAIRVGLDLLENAEYQKGVLGGKVLVRAASLTIFAPLPGDAPGTAVLKISRKDRDEAARFTDALANAIVNRRYEREVGGDG